METPGLAHEHAHEERVKRDELYRQQLEEARRRDPALNTPPPPMLDPIDPDATDADATRRFRRSRRHLSMVRLLDLCSQPSNCTQVMCNNRAYQACLNWSIVVCHVTPLSGVRVHKLVFTYVHPRVYVEGARSPLHTVTDPARLCCHSNFQYACRWNTRYSRRTNPHSHRGSQEHRRVSTLRRLSRCIVLV